MTQQSYLIDTNILIELEDYHEVDAAFAKFHARASVHKVDIYVHELSKDDIKRDRNIRRREISLSKIAKYPVLKKRLGLEREKLAEIYGSLKRPNDVVDATLLHAIESGAADFLVTQDKGLHERAQTRSAALARRILFIGDAIDLLALTYDPTEVPIRHVASIQAHEIDFGDRIFDSLREGYPEFDDWWRNKCVNKHRDCWVVCDYENGHLAGLIVRKDERAGDTDAVSAAEKILKICTFKVAPENRGVKLGELLLKQVLWYAQINDYELAYLTVYEKQASLINLLEYYGFRNEGENANGEFIYQRRFSSDDLANVKEESPFDLARKNYPRFVFDGATQGFGVPIKECYHDMLFPDLWDPRQISLFPHASPAGIPTRSGNSIRKVYLCRASSRLGAPGSLLFFYKGISNEQPSQAITALGVLESVTLAESTKELMQMTGGRSVYSEEEIKGWSASPENPVKVINFLHVPYFGSPVSLEELKTMGVVKDHPQQSIYKLSTDHLTDLVARFNRNSSI